MHMTETRPELADATTDDVITFPQGLVGCESWRRFVMLSEHEEELPVAVLECLDAPETRIMVTDPRLLLNQYNVSLNEADRSFLGLSTDADPILFCTLTVTNDGWLTANLLGPLALNPKTRTAKQIVLAESGYSTRHPVVQLGATQEA